MAGGRLRELVRKYGKVALGVHLSVSAASITGLYVAIKNKVDVEAILEKYNLGAVSEKDNIDLQNSLPSDGDLNAESLSSGQDTKEPKSRTAQLAASAGGTFALALLCNKALLPVRIPITVVLTPPIARFLARRNIIKSGV